jgi:hypothetical protein
MNPPASTPNDTRFRRILCAPPDKDIKGETRCKNSAKSHPKDLAQISPCTRVYAYKRIRRCVYATRIRIVRVFSGAYTRIRHARVFSLASVLRYANLRIRVYDTTRVRTRFRMHPNAPIRAYAAHVYHQPPTTLFTPGGATRAYLQAEPAAPHHIVAIPTRHVVYSQDILWRRLICG